GVGGTPKKRRPSAEKGSVCDDHHRRTRRRRRRRRRPGEFRLPAATAPQARRVRVVRHRLLVRLDPHHGFLLFAFGFAFGGPAFVGSRPLVFVGQLLVALNFAELAAHYPIAGCIYQWSRRLSTGVTGWFAGWTMLIGQIIAVSAAAIALQVVLPSVWSGFQLV